MPSFPPTDEQQKIVDAALTGFNLVVTAGAGTGKTSTMELVARAMRGRGLYAAFNKAAQLDAEARMPKNLKCMTSSALCRRYIVDTWGISTWNQRMNEPRQNGWTQARILGIRGPHRISAQKVLAPQQVARLVMETVDRFCFSADQEIGAWHVPKQTGITDPDERRELVAVILPFARRAWADVSGPRGDLKFSFDYAMKVWHLSGAANLAYDYIILDEAQDTNASWGSILSKQQTQLMVVGDGNQSLYHWRGASNAMPAFAAAPDTTVLQLSQSFRFGPAVAHEANKWLSLLDSDLRLKGFDKIASVVGPCDDPDAILCRTNAEAMVNVIRYQQAGVPVALVGGGDTMRRLAEASVELKEKGSTWHPDLCAFTSWGAVVDYVENDHGAGDLKVFVDLIEDYGADAIIHAANTVVTEDKARVVVSTGHKAKGREWKKVRIAEDFPPPHKDDSGHTPLPDREAMMLAYVAVTRAQQHLDPIGLAWVDQFLAAARQPVFA